MADAQAQLSAELARLRNAYLERLPAELAELMTLASQLTGGTDDSHLLQTLHQRLHKLAGSGGTFNLRKLSTQARAIEVAINGWLGTGSSMDADARSQLAADVGALKMTLSEIEPPTVSGFEQAVAVPVADDSRVYHLWLVDDDEQLGLELQRLLKQFGYDVRLFARLDTLIPALSVEQPDVLILDVIFSDESLNSTEEMLKQHVLGGLHCPIVFISARGDFTSRVRAARIGARGFLLKPLDVPKLVDQLEYLVEDRQRVPYRVMIVDDDETLSEHYRLVLHAAGMEVEVLNQPESMIDRIARFHPELVLMDMNMPGHSGPELASVIRQYDGWVGLPIVYLSAETDVDAQIRAMGVGADDFLTKPISDARLVAAITVRAARARQLSDLMSKDSLTGLFKHSRIKEELEIELLRAQRNGLPMCVAMVDIDYFKRVNDGYGHAVGDRVIKAVAHMLKQRLRKTDIIGRYGGEEFVVVLPECDAGKAQQILNDIRERFSTLRFHHEGGEFACTLSAGLACIQQYPQVSPGDLLVAADEALYQAKHGGRNQVCVARPEEKS